MGRIIRSLLKAAAACLALYLAAALGFALVPLKGRDQAPGPEKPPVYLCATMVHADFLIPVEAAPEWRAAFPELIPEGAGAGWIMAGWGDKGFFLETPTWADLKFSTAARALAGGDTVLRMGWIGEIPENPEGCLRLRLDGAGRAALRAHVLDSAAQIPAPLAAARPEALYYAAKGRYSPLETCNVWASRGLRKAGAPAALWAPFSFGVVWPLQAAP